MVSKNGFAAELLYASAAGRRRVVTADGIQASLSKRPTRIQRKGQHQGSYPSFPVTSRMS